MLDRPSHSICAAPVESWWRKAWLHNDLEVLRSLHHLQQQQQQQQQQQKQKQQQQQQDVRQLGLAAQALLPIGL
jgi:hypothetical protein